MDISILVPVYNEEKNIPLLYKKIKSVLDGMKLRYEILFVDDGSTDGTFDQLRTIKRKDSKVKVIQFQRNYEKAAALSCGFKAAKGDIVITMDADLQDEPNEIPRFVQKLDEGYDLVSGWKFKRKDPFSKRLPSKFFNFLTKMLTGIKIHDFNCGFKAYRNKVVKNLRIHGELHRYIPVLAKWAGFKVGEVKVVHYPRKYGKSKYGASRIFRGFLDLITVKFLTIYGRKPLHLFGLIGFLLSLLGLIAGLNLFYSWLNGVAIGNRPMLFLAMLLLLVGLQFFSIGLLGEIITFNRDSRYIIKKTL